MPEITIYSNAFEVAARLGVLGTVLIPGLITPMSQSLDTMENFAVDYMFSTFMNPTGALEGGFYQVITPGEDTLQGELVNPMAYAWRREMGFSGMTDSLGRYYANDPGIDYLWTTLNDTGVLTQVFSNFYNGLALSMATITGVP